jgi:hypothetical protein
MIAEVRYRRIVESRAAVTAVVYLVAMGLWIYVVEERQLLYGRREANLPLIVILAGVQLGAGLLIGRWWALALPLSRLRSRFRRGTRTRARASRSRPGSVCWSSLQSL